MLQKMKRIEGGVLHCFCSWKKKVWRRKECMWSIQEGQEEVIIKALT